MIMVFGRASLLTCLALTSLIFVARTAMAEGPGGALAGDVHTYARPDQVRVNHVALDLAVDFGAKVLRGQATLTLARAAGVAADVPLILDTRGLVIEGVKSVDGQALAFSVGKADPILGAPLSVTLPPAATAVVISYHTSPSASALQWLTTTDAEGHARPYLFTQSEAIHARSWIPLQDSPAVRVTYTATITVPEWATPVMSADPADPPGERAPRTLHRFKMEHPIPSYLIALAAGYQIEREPVGPRTGVWAQPALRKAAAWEFADLEAMVSSAEARYGPYRWGRYDILVLPPSFPFGGMENPTLTFATPTVIAGDRSLVSLAAHELAHSWSGNLVTNATWRDFWLNEGFTTYIERRIIEDRYGPRRTMMERVLGMMELRDELKTLPPRDQVLHIDLSGRDPDDGMTRIPYEKGALFLTTLEAAFGRDRFDAFLRGYFDHFAFRSITTAEFTAYLREHLFRLDPAAGAKIDLNAWLESPGLPAGYPEPDASVFAPIDATARAFASGSPATTLDTAGWSTHEWLRFLQSLPDSLTAERMAELDGVCHLTDKGNAEIVCQWLTLAVRHHYHAADRRLESFLTTIGRRKFLVPLYTELLKTPEGAKKARAIFAKAEPFYHPISATSIARLIAESPAKGK